MSHTAYGMLLDMFSLWDLLESDPATPASEVQKVGFREDLMLMLGDADGDGLQFWREVWQNDKAEFERRALARIHLESGD